MEFDTNAGFEKTSVERCRIDEFASLRHFLRLMMVSRSLILKTSGFLKLERFIDFVLVIVGGGGWREGLSITFIDCWYMLQDRKRMAVMSNRRMSCTLGRSMRLIGETQEEGPMAAV